MKILHCCLANFYIDNYSYQENIITKIHKIQGHDVEIIASTETYLDNLKLGYLKPGSYISRDNIKVTRIPYIRQIPHTIVKKLRLYEGLNNKLSTFKPDVIFLHDCQFLSINSIVRYARRNDVKIYVDSHTDFVNSARGWISKNILHKIIYKYCAKRIEKYTINFYGTLPLRCDFLHEVYGIKKDKIKLLPFGVDDSLFSYSDKGKYRETILKDLEIPSDDFVFITGGKIDERKKIHVLIKAFADLVNEKSLSNFHLIVFGKPTLEMKNIISELTIHKNIHYIEWIDSKNLFMYFFASDLAIFPGTHSVLWEEAVGLGIPSIFYSWKGIQHLDKGGNCLYIKNNSYDELKETLCYIISNPDVVNKMKEISAEVGPKYFSYSNIAREAIETN
jgi:glycosyltransferase involved in cell wall biosynthesis